MTRPSSALGMRLSALVRTLASVGTVSVGDLAALFALGPGPCFGSLLAPASGDREFAASFAAVVMPLRPVAAAFVNVTPAAFTRTVRVVPGSHRTVPLTEATVAALAAHCAEFPPVDGLVFTTTAGNAWRRNAVCDRWTAARKRARVQARGLHDLRHHYASLLIAGGCSVRAVSEVLGHANAAMTLNTYSHLLPADDDRIRSAVEAAWDAACNGRVTAVGNE